MASDSLIRLALDFSTIKEAGVRADVDILGSRQGSATTRLFSQSARARNVRLQSGFTRSSAASSGSRRGVIVKGVLAPKT